MSFSRGLLGAIVVAGVAQSCAGPRIVRSMTTTRDAKFRLLYDRNLGFGSFEQGLIDCKAQTDGSITDCQPVSVAFKEE